MHWLILIRTDASSHLGVGLVLSGAEEWAAAVVVVTMAMTPLEEARLMKKGRSAEPSQQLVQLNPLLDMIDDI